MTSSNKLSKKKKAEENKKRRTTWSDYGVFNPATKVIGDKKYNRAKFKKEAEKWDY